MSGSTTKEILAQEESLTQATRQLDINAFNRIYADDVLFTGATDQIAGKKEVIAEVEQAVRERDSAAAEGKKLVVSLDKEDIKVVTYGDAAVTTFRFMVKIETKNGNVHHRCRTMNVWLKRENQWQIIDKVWELRQYHGGNFVFGDQQMLVVITLTCQNCGNTLFFNAKKYLDEKGISV